MQYDVVIIGGGPSGMAAAIESSKLNAKTLIIERNETLGGILNQCIHNGFGLHYFKEELTGPEYAFKFRELILNEKNIDVKLNTFVTNIDKENNVVTIKSSNGVENVKYKSLVLSMGCRERTAGNILLTGTRPVGIYTAGTAQKLVNIYGKMIGKNVVILGSGDIGLIMARRLTLEGAKVQAVMEINKTSSGLRRNISQCLDDFNIPLMHSTTIFEVVGEKRVEGIYYGQVDENYNKLEDTRKFMSCDAIILSVGLVPETDLVSDLKINRVTNGTYVNDYMQTEYDNIFACGNFLHVHDLVDNVTMESLQAGKCAALNALGKLERNKEFNVLHSDIVTYTIPSTIVKGEGKVDLKFRVRKKFVKSNLIVSCNDKIIAKKFVMAGLPGEMLTISFDKSEITGDINLEVKSNEN